ncbi:MAG: SIR2 family protein [Bacteroidota bacterium]
MVKKIRKTIESANINFLIGSGLSRPFLEVLNDVEIFLSDSQKTSAEITAKKKEYFNKVMVGNLDIINDTSNMNKDDVLTNYKNFYKILNNILLKRENSILTKQVNIFTTNVDIFSEKALEDTGIEFNDGFHGRFRPVFSLSNFKKSYFKKSLHYENTSEIPVFNILKLHGSLTWKYNKAANKIFLDCNLDCVKKVKADLSNADFDKSYKELIIVNPNKEKFEDTLVKQYYYDLLRIYSNELEKENCLLFVLGFSFADEHIRDLTARVADSNPTLKTYIFSHGTSTTIYDNLRDEAKNRNIEIIVPEVGKNYDLKTLNADIFEKIIAESEDVVDPAIGITAP